MTKEEFQFVAKMVLERHTADVTWWSDTYTPAVEEYLYEDVTEDLWKELQDYISEEA